MRSRVGSAPRNGIAGNPSQTTDPRGAEEPLAVRMLGGPRGPPREVTLLSLEVEQRSSVAAGWPPSAVTPPAPFLRLRRLPSPGNIPTISIMNSHVMIVRTELAFDKEIAASFTQIARIGNRRHRHIRRQNVSFVFTSTGLVLTTLRWILLLPAPTEFLARCSKIDRRATGISDF